MRGHGIADNENRDGYGVVGTVQVEDSVERSPHGFGVKNLDNRGMDVAATMGKVRT